MKTHSVVRKKVIIQAAHSGHNTGRDRGEDQPRVPTKILRYLIEEQNGHAHHIDAYQEPDWRRDIGTFVLGLNVPL